MGCLESQHAQASQPCRPVMQGYAVNQGYAPGQPVQGYAVGQPWACSACTYLNPVARPACEECGTWRPGYYAEPGHAQAGCVQPVYAQAGYAEPGHVQAGYAQPCYGQSGYGYQQGAYQQNTGGGGMSSGMAMGMAGVGGLAAGFLAAEVIDDIF
eukprot:TRINITY_DN2647_c0_g1_i1.p1 TRINITY_DN2647_c0_g1~~TRINITY_DN2647_c0_g1_i1.p1  ORF type:complete len:155 (-),score=25.12 TRINITY_DN2647_c0_g1_i1:166-630(-)